MLICLCCRLSAMKQWSRMRRKSRFAHIFHYNLLMYFFKGHHYSLWTNPSFKWKINRSYLGATWFIEGTTSVLFFLTRCKLYYKKDEKNATKQHDAVLNSDNILEWKATLAPGQQQSFVVEYKVLYPIDKDIMFNY